MITMEVFHPNCGRRNEEHRKKTIHSTDFEEPVDTRGLSRPHLRLLL